jgi:glycosyltransferase involved in cell wall biosynthesis
LRDYASSMRLNGNIDFCGYLNDAKALGILKSAKVFLFPSYEEGFGIAILQAMACELPVVAYKLPVYQEIFKNKLITVPPGHTDLMSQRVIFLLENPAVAKTIGKEGIDLAKQYDWEKIASHEVKLMESLIKQNQ